MQCWTLDPEEGNVAQDLERPRIILHVLHGANELSVTLEDGSHREFVRASRGIFAWQRQCLILPADVADPLMVVEAAWRLVPGFLAWAEQSEILLLVRSIDLKTLLLHFFLIVPIQKVEGDERIGGTLYGRAGNNSTALDKAVVVYQDIYFLAMSLFDVLKKMLDVEDLILRGADANAGINALMDVQNVHSCRGGGSSR